MEINLSLLSIQNPWWTIDWQGKKRKHSGLNFDPTIINYINNNIKWHPKIIKDIDLNKSNIIYFLQGPPGVGKSTTSKILIKDLIENKKINPDNILYYSCHNFYTFEQLNEVIKTFLAWRTKQKSNRLYLFIDEIETAKNWDKGLEHLYNTEKLKKISIVASGTSLGISKYPNYIKTIKINPLSFAEFYHLLNTDSKLGLNLKNYKNIQTKLDYYLDIYLLTGGYIGALNSFKKNGSVKQTIYNNHLSWLISDINCLGRDTTLLKQILTELLKNLGLPIGYKTIARKTKAKTHLTIAEYLEILKSIFVTRALYQSDKKGNLSISKAKKIYFSDPFLFWIAYAFIYGSLNFWEFSRERLHIEEIYYNLIKNIVLNHLDKLSPAENVTISYWRDNIKKAEIDFIYKNEKSIWPIIVCQEKEILIKEKIFATAGFKQGIIITPNTFAKSKYKVVPLNYFLLFSQTILK